LKKAENIFDRYAAKNGYSEAERKVRNFFAPPPKNLIRSAHFDCWAVADALLADN
jgi:hypothetical protein